MSSFLTGAVRRLEDRGRFGWVARSRFSSASTECAARFVDGIARES